MYGVGELISTVRLGNVSCSMFPFNKKFTFPRRDQSFRRGVDGSVNSVRLLLAGTAIDVEPASTEQEADNRSRARERRERDARRTEGKRHSRRIPFCTDHSIIFTCNGTTNSFYAVLGRVMRNLIENLEHRVRVLRGYSTGMPSSRI